MPEPDWALGEHLNGVHSLHVTNLHTHGLDVAPGQSDNGTYSDDIFLRIVPTEDAVKIAQNPGLYAEYQENREWVGTVLLRIRKFGPLDFASVQLPAGGSVRIDLDLGDGQGSSFFLDSDSGFYVLACRAEEAPPDRWSSIAETLEFVPVGN